MIFFGLLFTYVLNINIYNAIITLEIMLYLVITFLAKILVILKAKLTIGCFEDLNPGGNKQISNLLI